MVGALDRDDDGRQPPPTVITTVRDRPTTTGRTTYPRPADGRVARVLYGVAARVEGRAGGEWVGAGKVFWWQGHGRAVRPAASRSAATKRGPAAHRSRALIVKLACTRVIVRRCSRRHHQRATGFTTTTTTTITTNGNRREEREDVWTCGAIIINIIIVLLLL